MQAPWAAQDQHVAQSAGAVQSTPPSLDDASTWVPPSSLELDPSSAVVLVTSPVVLVSSPPSLVPGIVVFALVTVSDAPDSWSSPSESSPPQPTSAATTASRSHRITQDRNIGHLLATTRTFSSPSPASEGAAFIVLRGVAAAGTARRCARPDPSQIGRVNLHDTALGVRWAIGDVSDDGFEALQMSVWGARRLFGARTAYDICVHTLTVEQARAKTGVLPEEVRWRKVERELPPWLSMHIGSDAEARDVGWKLVPLRLYPDRFELSLDNDCILWEMPVTIAAWLTDNHPTRCLLAEDVRLCSGRFAADHPEPRNTCIRGLPPGFDLGAALAEELDVLPGNLASELDELGLQVAAVSRHEPPCVVPVADVTICSPFPPHHLALGRCGAHFVGINAKQLDRPGREAKDVASEDGSTDHFREHWRRHRHRLFELVGLAAPTGGDERSARSVPDTSYGV